MKTDDLGQTYKYAANDKITPHMLTLHELGELIRRMGIQLGFRPVAEHQVSSKQTKSKKRYIDWVWKDAKTNKVIAAFEIEGANCGMPAVNKDSNSLCAAKCKFKYVLLYQARKDKRLTLRDDIKKEFKKLTSKRIKLLLDTDLMDGGIDKFMEPFQTA